MRQILILTLMLSTPYYSFATQEMSCQKAVDGTEIIRGIGARISTPTDTDRQKYFLNNRWQIPASEVPFTIEAFLAGDMLVRPYFTHTTNRVNSWVGELVRGVIPLDEAVNRLSKKGNRKDIRKALKDSNLRVKLDYQFEGVVDACMNTPHALPKFSTDAAGNLVFGGLSTDEGSGRTLYYRSTWISDEIKAFYMEGFKRGVLHSIGVFATDADGKERLAAGSLFFAHEGTPFILTSFTAKRITATLTPPGTPAREERLLTEVLYSNAGHVEEAASILLLDHLGYTFIDTGLMYPGFGMAYNFGGSNIPIAEFLRLKAETKDKARSPFPAPGADITELLSAFAAVR